MDLTEAGLGDVTFIVENEKIKTFISIMSLKNVFFQEKLENSEDKTTIQTDDYITINGFKDLLCYYGGGIVDIEDYNVVDILLVCFSFYENDLLNVCIKYKNIK